mmetsp:Transcript_11341/g.33462  ORF Transcript_11341/g.33462 Transcript_11341/m.33462 type:complete len:223 (+) Transcript_11341:1153-1821(+)
MSGRRRAEVQHRLVLAGGVHGHGHGGALRQHPAARGHVVIRDRHHKRDRRGFALGRSQLGINEERQVVDVVVREVPVEVGVVEKRTRVGFISRRGTVRAAGHEDRRNTFVVVRERSGLDEGDVVIGVLLGGVDLDADAAVGGQRFRGTDVLVDIAGRRQFVRQLDAPRGDAKIEILLNLIDIVAVMRRIKHYLIDHVYGVRDQVVGGRELAGADGTHAHRDG